MWKRAPDSKTDSRSLLQFFSFVAKLPNGSSVLCRCTHASHTSRSMSKGVKTPPTPLACSLTRTHARITTSAWACRVSRWGFRVDTTGEAWRRGWGREEGTIQKSDCKEQEYPDKSSVLNTRTGFSARESKHYAKRGGLVTQNTMLSPSPTNFLFSSTVSPTGKVRGTCRCGISKSISIYPVWYQTQSPGWMAQTYQTSTGDHTD